MGEGDLGLNTARGGQRDPSCCLLLLKHCFFAAVNEGRFFEKHHSSTHRKMPNVILPLQSHRGNGGFGVTVVAACTACVMESKLGPLACACGGYIGCCLAAGGQL